VKQTMNVNFNKKDILNLDFRKLITKNTFRRIRKEGSWVIKPV